MPGIHSQQDLRDDVARDAGGVTNITRLLNRAARFVVSDIDLRSTKRMATLSPNLNENLNDYQAPADLKEQALIDIRLTAAGRREEDKFDLVTTEYFDRNKTDNSNIVCVEDRDWLKKLRISADTRENTDREVVLHDLDSLTADGTWTVSGNASNLTLDSDHFVHGEASLNFDMAASYTAASAVVSGMTAVDISDFETGGSVFVLMHIPTITGLTSINIKVGSASTTYFRQSRTVTNENLSFYVGWNLLRLDFSGATETGTVDMDNVDYLEIGIVGDGTAAISTDWRLDYFVARRGKPHEIFYYTRYPWQAGSTYLEESTATTDTLNADSTMEYELFVLKTKEIIAMDLKNFDDMKIYRDLYEDAKIKYGNSYSSEKLQLRQTNWKFETEPQNSWLN